MHACTQLLTTGYELNISACYPSHTFHWVHLPWRSCVLHDWVIRIIKSFLWIHNLIQVGLLDGNGELASITQNQNIHPKPTGSVLICLKCCHFIAMLSHDLHIYMYHSLCLVQMIALPVSSPARSVQASTSGVVTPRIIKVATPHAASPVVSPQMVSSSIFL